MESPYEYMVASRLIRDAMRNVRIAQCPECQGARETLEGPCGTCEGVGQVVTNELESSQA